MEKWEYKGYQLSIESMEDDDGCDENGTPIIFHKAWHEVVTPDGVRMVAAISPYDWDRETLEMYVDAGCPPRKETYYGSCNWDSELLKAVLI